MKIYTFTLQGKPPAQKQTRFSRGHAYDPSKKDSNYIKMQLMEQMRLNDWKMLEGPVRVRCMFTFTPAASLSLKKKEKLLNEEYSCTKRIDLSNLYYIVENAMKGIVFIDDSQVVSLFLRKIYSDRNDTVLQVYFD